MDRIKCHHKKTPTSLTMTSHTVTIVPTISSSASAPTPTPHLISAPHLHDPVPPTAPPIIPVPPQKTNLSIVNDDEDDDYGDCEVRSNDDDDDAGSLVDFVVESDDDDAEEGSDDEQLSEHRNEREGVVAREMHAKDLDGIDSNNIIQGTRRRKQTTRYEDSVYASAEYRKMVLCDVPDDEIEAINDSDDESEDEEEGEDGDYVEKEGSDEEGDEEGDDVPEEVGKSPAKRPLSLKTQPSPSSKAQKL